MQPSTCRFGTPENQGSIIFGITFDEALVFPKKHLNLCDKSTLKKGYAGWLPTDRSQHAGS